MTDDEDYHFILEAYGEKKHVIHIPTEIAALEEAFEKYHNELFSRSPWKSAAMKNLIFVCKLNLILANFLQTV